MPRTSAPLVWRIPSYPTVVIGIEMEHETHSFPVVSPGPGTHHATTSGGKTSHSYQATIEAGRGTMGQHLGNASTRNDGSKASAMADPFPYRPHLAVHSLPNLIPPAPVNEDLQ